MSRMMYADIAISCEVRYGKIIDRSSNLTRHKPQEI